MKEKIKKQLIQKISEELEGAKLIANSTKDLTTKGDFKSDGKYDTRGIEAGYLAGAQQKRVDELTKDLELLESIEFFQDNEEVTLGALVGLEFNGNVRDYFISSAAGGNLVKVEGRTILVISVFSPIGQAAIGLKINDEFEVEQGEMSRIYKVLTIE